MRTPVLLVSGQADTDAVVDVLARDPGTVVVTHRFDGHIVKRSVVSGGGARDPQVTVLELAHGCVSCTVRDDLLVLLRKLHRREDVGRIVLHLEPWLEADPICWAIKTVPVRMGPGYIDGPAARDVEIAGVVSCVDTANWLEQALGDDELDDGRTVAQVVIGQAEFADVLVVRNPEPEVLSVLRRLAPRARITARIGRVEQALDHLEDDARCGRADDPHGPLLAGQPSLAVDGRIALVEFNARRPFHPERLHAAIDLLLDGVIRTRGRLWLATQDQQAMWLESAGGGLRVSAAGKWLAAMDSAEARQTDLERRAFADLMWDYRFGDRHTAMTVLICGAESAEVLDALRGALLTDDEMASPASWEEFSDPFGEWHEDPCEHVSELEDFLSYGDYNTEGNH
ncbi:ribosome hibernation factor-recruiting GTPase MRF [Mycobacteroides salmoniphilum]|uniref:Metal chaperone YciC n=1 Tax=Mycobacteroides salmoniphilum TaxID=404941 RepID=A0A4R8SQV4_9MYCO|nr:GTP-binding protein [Mycobacteroides salmoniphilum]TDZ98400.1 putative metal chaperone YciC [Mycobacteroides salmoniphilum]TEA02120.1 putative metal chaperone YciC [Mycobacteroides salmoniphilum]TEA02930.1 putative metal chaperone YciC [Mycobacteroides salmoniphilum]